MILVSGAGTKMGDRISIRSRAKRKLITVSVILAMIDVARKKGAMDRVKKYWNTYHCQRRVFSAEGRLYGKYCKNRFCTLCSGIRKAELINKYLPIVEQWKEPHLVTLTVKSVPARKLKFYLNNMVRGFRIICRRCKKRNQRGKGIKIMGLKSFESNFNPISKTYNPHFHILVPDKNVAELLIKEWLNLWTTKYTHKNAQHVRPIKDAEKDLVEDIKYGSKTFTEPGANRKNRKKSRNFVYAAALDTIYAAMEGHRIFERFGFNLPANQMKKQPMKWVEKTKEWHYSLKAGDWLNTQDDAPLSGYTPPTELISLLEMNIETDLQ